MSQCGTHAQVQGELAQYGKMARRKHFDNMDR